MITKEEFKKQVTLTDLCGGCLNGLVDIAYAKLVDLLGEPNCENDGYKVDAEWAVSFKDETFSIYNYKSGKNYNGEEGLPLEEIRDWHIGGKNKEKAAELIELLESTE